MDDTTAVEGAAPVRSLMHVLPFAPVLPEKLPIIFHFTFELTQVCLAGDSVCRSCRRTPLAIQNAFRGDCEVGSASLDDALVLFIQNICLDDLLLNVADHKVVVLQSSIMPDALMDSVLRCFRGTFAVPLVSFVSSAVAGVLSTGMWTGLAMETDYITCALTPVVHGRALAPATHILSSGTILPHAAMVICLLDAISSLCSPTCKVDAGDFPDAALSCSESFASAFISLTRSDIGVSTLLQWAATACKGPYTSEAAIPAAVRSAFGFSASHVNLDPATVKACIAATVSFDFTEHLDDGPGGASPLAAFRAWLCGGIKVLLPDHSVEERLWKAVINAPIDDRKALQNNIVLCGSYFMCEPAERAFWQACTQKAWQCGNLQSPATTILAGVSAFALATSSIRVPAAGHNTAPSDLLTHLS